MFENVLKAKMRFFHVCPTGRIINRFSQDIALVDEQLVRTTTIVCQDIPMYLSLVIVIGFNLPLALLAAMVACLLYILVRQYFIPTARYSTLTGKLYRQKHYNEYLYFIEQYKELNL